MLESCLVLNVFGCVCTWLKFHVFNMKCDLLCSISSGGLFGLHRTPRNSSFKWLKMKIEGEYTKNDPQIAAPPTFNGKNQGKMGNE